MFYSSLDLRRMKGLHIFGWKISQLWNSFSKIKAAVGPVNLPGGDSHCTLWTQCTHGPLACLSCLWRWWDGHCTLWTLHSRGPLACLSCLLGMVTAQRELCIAGVLWPVCPVACLLLSGPFHQNSGFQRKSRWANEHFMNFETWIFSKHF